MVEIGAVKIRRGIYRFESRKRFQFVQRYRRVERKPLDKLRDSLRAMLSPKKEAKKEALTAAAPGQGGFNFGLIIAVVVVALLVLGGGYLWVQSTMAQFPTIQSQPIETASISDTVASSEVLTAGSRGSETHAAAMLVDYNTTGLVNYSVSLTTYAEELPTEVFILNSGHVEVSRYSDFLSSLRAELGQRGIKLNEISFEQLETVPKGSEIIVPSGVVPQQLLIGRGNLTRLINEGVVVIYIGQSFKSILNGTTVMNTPSELLEDSPVNFDESVAPTCAGNFSLYQPLYRAYGTSGLSTTMVYGCVAALKSGTGTLLMVPQTVDGGWPSKYRIAAQDIARIVIEAPWAVPDGASLNNPTPEGEAPEETFGAYYLVNGSNESATIAGRQYFFTKPYDGKTRTVRAYFAGSTPGGMLFEDIKIVRATQLPKGELFVSQLSVTSTNVTGEQIRMNARLNESVPASPLMYLVFTDSSGKEVLREQKGNINTQSQDVNLDVDISVDQGEYKVSLEDDSGKVYAATYLSVGSVSISGPEQGAKSSVYIFNIDTPVTLKTMTVDVDNGVFTQEYTSVSSGIFEVDVSPYTGGDALSFGNHTFTFKAGQFTRSVEYNRPLPPPPFPPEFLFITLFAGGIVGVGVFFARKEQVIYSIDVPDFPPVSRTKIPLNAETVLSVFDKVNDSYRWEYTPLTPGEVKNGFKNIYFRGSPIYITDYNTEFLLNDLVRRKLVKEFMEYYGLASWEQKSGRTVRYLVMLRRLRDICVNNAVPFTQLGESEVCDSEVTVVGQQMFLHFFDRDSAPAVVQRALSTISSGITIVMFKDDSEKAEFSGMLNSTTRAPIVMKLEVEGNSILLLTYDEFEKMVQEFKGV